MHLVILAFVLYAVLAEWRNMSLRSRLAEVEKNLGKFKKDKTIWYTDVLPQPKELCLFEGNGGEYVIGKLNDKRWQNKNGEADFSKIKRWASLKDLESL